jgi:3D (Asp-Asp-Asp) domain-containing protein
MSFAKAESALVNPAKILSFMGFAAVFLISMGCKQTGRVHPPYPAPAESGAGANGPLIPQVPQSAAGPGTAAASGAQAALLGPAEFRSFDFPSPSASDTVRTVSLWATHYYIATITAAAGKDTPIKNKQEASLFGDQNISKAEWCDLAKQGSGFILPSNGNPIVVSFAARSSVNPIDCNGVKWPDGRIVVGRRDVAETIRGNRFERVEAVFARGARVKEVIPFRTIAVNPSNPLPYGTVIFIPAARGQQVTLGDGSTAIHDGYFFAGDTGGSLAANQIDINTGLKNYRPFEFVKSNSKETFEAKLIENPVIVEKMKKLHGYSGAN